MTEIKLNSQQKKAIEHHGSPLLIIAGAGTGKTTVITERVKWLISKKGLLPSQILALTFTEKAAAEMEERIDVSLPMGYSQLWISTFHSFCDRILRNEAVHIGLDSNFKLMTEAESILFLKNQLFKLELNYFRPASNPTKFLKELVSHFSRLQDEDIFPDQYLKFADKQSKQADTEEEKLEAEKTQELARGYLSYQELKDKSGVMDFADLIGNTLKLFRSRPNVLKNIQGQFKHILVDEYQDTNIAQNELVRLLEGGRGAITVVGDDNQSIYKWRGAAVSNIIGFMETYKNAKTIVLTTNYRSTQTILDQTYKLIKNNDPDTLEAKLKIPKKLISSRGTVGDPVVFFFTQNVDDEADAVAKKIEKLSKSKYQYKDFAILVRANNHSEPFLRSLSRLGIPFQFLGPGQLFKQPEIKDLISYLTVINDPQNDPAVFRVFSMDIFSVLARDLAFIKSFAKKQNLSLFEALEKVARGKKSKKRPIPRISKKTKEKVKNLVSMIHHHLSLVNKETGGQILYYFLQDSQILKNYLDPKTEKDQKTVLNIAKFFDKVKSFEGQSDKNSVADLLDWVTLRMEMGESPLASETDWSENDAVNILTVHSAKGLEFPIVFLVNLVNQRFPTNRRSEVIPVPQPLIKEMLPQGDPHEQEERRLFYVGATRAKDKLFLTAAKFYGEGKMQKKVSPFVAEILGDKELEKIIAVGEIKNKKSQLSLIDWEKNEQKDSPVRPNQPISYLSYSRFDSFHICPRQYKFKYVLNIPTPPSSSQTFGDTVHKTLKNFYQFQLVEKEKLPLKTLLSFLSKNWSSIGFSNKEDEKINKQRAVNILSRFYKDEFNYSKIGQIVALEQPFSFKISPTLKIGGVIDRIDNIDKNKIEIIDYKTAEKTPTQKDVDGNEQLTTYALATTRIKELSFNRPVENIVLSLYYLDSGVRISSTRTEAQLEKTRQRIIETAKELETTNFPPKPNRPFPCDYCELKLLCDAWK